MEPTPSPPKRVRKRVRVYAVRKRHTNIKPLLVVAAVCLLGLALIPWASNRRKPAPDTPGFAGMAISEPVRDTSIALADCAFVDEGSKRVLRGKVRNTAKVAYRDVEVRLNVWDRAHHVLGIAAATIARIEPGAITGFETNPVPKTAVIFFPERIEGVKAAK